MSGQIKDVALALTQGRQGDGELCEAVIQVFAKQPLADQLRQVAMGGGDDPHINFMREV